MAQGYALGQQSTWLNQANNGGRLTLTTGTPVTTSNVTAATTIYYTPYISDYISLYDGSSLWQTYAFNELNIAVPATTNTMYDVFIYLSGGVLTLEAVSWTNDTTRATAIVLQDGVYVKSGATTRRYLGSFRTTAVSGQTEDSLTKRWLYNYNNRVNRQMVVTDTANTWTYSTASYRQANANTANQLDFIQGVAEDNVTAIVTHRASSSGTTARNISVGVGLDSTTVNSAQVFVGGAVTSALTTASPQIANYYGIPSAGRHYLAWLEYGGGTDTQTWYGDNGATLLQTGIQGIMRG